jgi:hypothetical protein
MPVEAVTPGGVNPVTSAIRRAARVTGADFQYLLATAKVESDLDPRLTARSSTATGLFQFIEQTWLATLKQAGPAFGYGHYADAILQSSAGTYSVEDPAVRAEIMQLRTDPAANALMGGVFTQQNAAVMGARLGRAPSEGELYIGHFFGPYAGTRALALAASRPDAIAAEVFPVAAQTNRPIFYDKQGNARTIAAVCEELARRYNAARVPGRPAEPAVAAAPAPATIATAAEGPTGSSGASRPVSPAAVQAAALAYAAGADRSAAPRAPAAGERDIGRAFHSLFHSIEPQDAVAPAVSDLWTGQRRAPDDGGGRSADK